ncbi:MAG: protein kinase [Sulfuriferula sp.]
MQLGTLLGEGASGKIYQAQWQGNQSVAVKLYKGSVTSDGLPDCELAACVAAGTHPQLMPILGVINDHPEHTAGLVMPLIAAHYRNLAAPPSLASCTRDIYAADVTLRAASALRMAAQVASAMQHIHARGLTHGDLYAHNILWNGTDDVLLGDFGAATFINDVQAQRLEVLAFAHLLAELLGRAADAELADAWTLQQQCAQTDVMQRPLFAEIAHQLQTLVAKSSILELSD